MDYEFDRSNRSKKKNQTHQKLPREIFIPDAISVSNLAKTIGVHLGEQLTCYQITIFLFIILL